MPFKSISNIIILLLNTLWLCKNYDNGFIIIAILHIYVFIYFIQSYFFCAYQNKIIEQLKWFNLLIYRLLILSDFRVEWILDLNFFIILYLTFLLKKINKNYKYIEVFKFYDGKKLRNFLFQVFIYLFNYLTY